MTTHVHHHHPSKEEGRRKDNGLVALLALPTPSVDVFIRSFAVMIFAFENQPCVPPVAAELEDDTRGAGRRLPRTHILAFSIGACVAVTYLLICLAVCAQTGLSTQPDFLANYAKDDIEMVFCRALLLATMTLSMVLNVYPCLQSLGRVLSSLGVLVDEDTSASPARVDVNIIEDDGPRPRVLAVIEHNKQGRTIRSWLLKHFCCVGTLSVAAGVAISVRNVANFISTASSLFSSLIDLGIPALLVLAARGRAGNRADAVDVPVPRIGPLALCSLTVLMWWNTLCNY